MRAAFFGDSTQFGGKTGTSASAEAQRLLQRRGVAIETVNCGVPGSWARLLLAGWDKAPPFPEILAAEPAQIVAFRFGINDTKRYEPAFFASYMHQLIDLAHQARRVVIIETPSPVTLARYVPGVADNVQVLRHLHRQSFFPTTLLCDHNRIGYEGGFENSDGVHPTARAYRAYQAAPLAAALQRAAARVAA